MHSAAKAAEAAAVVGLKTFSRRYKLQSKSPEALASKQLTAAGDGGLLNARAPKARKAVVVKQLVSVSNLQVEKSTAVGSSEVSSAVVTEAKSRGSRNSRLKRVANEENNLVVELSEKRSNARRISRKLTFAETTSCQQRSSTDFWHCSLSGNSGITELEEAEAQVLVSRTLSTPKDIAAAIDHLTSADSLLKAVIEMHERPKFEKCTSAFASLGRSIVFQQLATKAAAAIFARLVTLCDGLDNFTPSVVSQLSVQQLRAVGISERKASYLHDLAAHFLSGALSDSSINALDDDALMKALIGVKGIGVWSVHMFMLFSLHKPDVLPVGDLGVRKGVQKLYQLKALPTPAEVEKIASSWQPYRSIGAWYMWRVVSNSLPLKLVN